MAAFTVLVVDDDPGIRESLGDLLRAEGYAVRAVENGALALQILRSDFPPDVMVLDLMMPVMSGWEVLEEVEADASFAFLPILVVSAIGAPLAASERGGGVRASLPKPLDVDLLLDTVGGLVSATATTSLGRPQASAAR